MAEWECHGEYKVIRCGTTIEKEQKEALGYGGRVIERLRCTACNKLTLVDKSIRYDYCPHCGEKMRQYWEMVYPTWGRWLSKTFGKPSSILLSTAIPADIAPKLGIEPKEG